MHTSNYQTKKTCCSQDFLHPCRHTFRLVVGKWGITWSVMRTASCRISFSLVLVGITREHVQQFIPLFYSSYHIEAFVHGNVLQQVHQTIHISCRTTPRQTLSLHTIRCHIRWYHPISYLDGHCKSFSCSQAQHWFRSHVLIPYCRMVSCHLSTSLCKNRSNQCGENPFHHLAMWLVRHPPSI